MTAKIDILKKWYKDVWSDGQIDVIPQFYRPCPNNDWLLPQSALEPGEIAEIVTILRSFLQEISIEFVHYIEDGAWVSLLLNLNSDRADTGATVTAVWQVRVRFEGDMFVEVYSTFDFLQFFEQLGQLPADTYALLLSGTHLK